MVSRRVLLTLAGFAATVVLWPLAVVVMLLGFIVWTFSGVGPAAGALFKRRGGFRGQAPKRAAGPPEAADLSDWAALHARLARAGAPALAPLDAGIAEPEPWRGILARRERGPLGKAWDWLALELQSFVIVGLIWVWFGVLRWLLRPELVFVAYPGHARQIEYYANPLVMSWIPPVVPLGSIRRGNVWGAYGFATCVASDLQEDPERVARLLECVRRAFPFARSVALAGRLPSTVHAAGLPLERPFVDGVLGTVYAMERSVRALVERAGRPASDTRVCVLGGGGFVGRALLPQLEPHYRSLIAIDPRFANDGGRREEGAILRTPRASDVALADVVLVLTARGDDALMYAPYARAGQVWGDDTHPEMGDDTREALTARGVDLHKVSVDDAQLQFLPRLKTWPRRSTPGCMLMAAVHRLHGEAALADFDAFSRAADSLGFEALLHPHERSRKAAASPDPALSPATLAALADAFRQLDRDGDGRLTPDELLDVLEQEASPERAAEMVRAADIDGDGRVAYEEFVRVWARVAAGAPGPGATRSSGAASGHPSRPSPGGLG